MVERPAGKARKRAAKPADTAPKPISRDSIPKEASVEARIRALEAERDRLMAELAAARTRISDLERSREQIVNRIDWVIDSLHSLLEE